MEETVKCSKCGNEKAAFCFSKFQKDVLKPECRECSHREASSFKLLLKEAKKKDRNNSTSYYSVHKEKISQYMKQYQKTDRGRTLRMQSQHRRRMREFWSENTLTAQEWEEIIRRQENMCNVCGEKFTDTRKPTHDHIIPVSEGGGLTFENVQALCKNCNSRKSNKVSPNFMNKILNQKSSKNTL